MQPSPSTPTKRPRGRPPGTPNQGQATRERSVLALDAAPPPLTAPESAGALGASGVTNLSRIHNPKELLALVDGRSLVHKIQDLTAWLTVGIMPVVDESRLNPDPKDPSSSEQSADPFVNIHTLPVARWVPLTKDDVPRIKAAVDANFRLLNKVMPDLKSIDFVDNTPRRPLNDMELATRLVAVMAEAGKDRQTLVEDEEQERISAVERDRSAPAHEPVKQTHTPLRRPLPVPEPTPAPLPPPAPIHVPVSSLDQFPSSQEPTPAPLPPPASIHMPVVEVSPLDALFSLYGLQKPPKEPERVELLPPGVDDLIPEAIEKDRQLRQARDEAQRIRGKLMTSVG